ncbi:rab family GTP-binding protein [Rhodotorula toruloides]|uniref:Rab family GTP-binding protein n=1 Tax=Rhodotorula toruloides TaxID=5286 RepID=A0A511KHX7_RHOTO|nr:rab family GTP-binding protein [Rhodotorula toruloides]
MATLVSSIPSPPLPSSPESLSSGSSNTASSNSCPPLPPPAALFPTYTSFDSPKMKGFPPHWSAPTASPAGSTNSQRQGRTSHRAAQTMSHSRDPSSFLAHEGTPEEEPATTSPPMTRRTHRSSQSVSPTPISRTPSAKDVDSETPQRVPPRRSRTLSFSAAQQAFVPARPRLSHGVGSAGAFPFPRLEEGKVASSVALDRTSSTGSSSSVVVRPPRRSRTTLSTRIVPTSQRPARPGAATDYLEAKVVIVGSQGVGKTSLIHRSTTGKFNHSLSSTMGAGFLTKKLTISDTKVHFQLWDTAGGERFRSLAKLYYRGALAAILVYDVTDESSLQDLKFWLQELRKNMSEDLIILVVGTKADLAGSYPTIPLADAQRYVALCMHELGESSPDSTISSTPTRSREPTPVARPPQVRNSFPSQPLPTRARTYSSPLLSTAEVPTVTTTPPVSNAHAPPAMTAFDDALISSRGRATNRLAQSTGPSSHPPGQPPPPRFSQHTRPASLSSSMTLPDLSAYTLSSLAGQPSAHDSLQMVRSGSAGAPASGTSPTTSSGSPTANGSQISQNAGTAPSISAFGLMSFGSSLGDLVGASALSRRKSQQDDVHRFLQWPASTAIPAASSSCSNIAASRGARALESARIQQIVDDCPIEVVEVSAKDGFGIEECFWTIAERLIERKEEIERRRVLRNRDSIVLREDDADAVAAAGAKGATGACAC